MSFAQLKKGKKDFQALAAQMKTAGKGSFSKDERLWELTVDKSGVGQAIIRFLPAPTGHEFPYVLRYGHGFKNPTTNKWLIENCPTTLGQGTPCPICERNSELWNTGTETNKNIVRERKRQQSYYANIYVVNDPANPENNDKVFLFRFGSKIFEMITDKISPQFEEEAVNVFDFWEGANFRLRSTMVNKQRSYDKSTWDTSGPLFNCKDEDELNEKLEEVYNKEHNLLDLIAPKEFKTYEQLTTRLNQTLGVSAKPVQQEQQVEDDFPFEPDEQVVTEEKSLKMDDDLSEYADLLNS